MLSLDKPSKTYLHMSALGFASFKALLDFNEGMDIDIGAEVTDSLKIEGRPSTNNELNEMVTSFMKEEKLGALKRGSFLTMIFEALRKIGYTSTDAFNATEVFRIHYYSAALEVEVP